MQHALDPRLGGMQVLVVEDDIECRELFRLALEACGAVVTTAESAREGLQALQAQGPTVLLSDISMPGDDGYWLIREARRGNFRNPAIAVTARVGSAHRAQALAAGFDEHVPKPVDPWELCALVERWACRASDAPIGAPR
jgi:CheY-like chemotaxis protein